MTQDALQNLQTARRYLSAIEHDGDAESVGQFLHAQIVAQRNYDCYDPW